jgi:estrogen-related receptor beta like 1
LTSSLFIIQGPVYTLWENSLEKLKILNYEKDYCKKYNRKYFFHSLYFSLPQSNQSHQFNDFSTLCSWLISEITMKNDIFKIEQFDDPNTIVNKLLVALRQLDFRSNFPPSKLKIPYGEPVCTVLDFLTEKALTARGFQWGTPVHNDLDEVRIN